MPVKVEISTSRLANLEVRLTVAPWGLAESRDLFVLWSAEDCSDVEGRDEGAPGLPGFRMRKFQNAAPGTYVLELRPESPVVRPVVYACLGRTPPSDLGSDEVAVGRGRLP